MNDLLTEYRFGSYRVVDGGRALFKDGEPVAISPKVLGVLVELLRAPGRVVSKTELLETVWAGSFVEDGSLTQSISVLRKLLAADFAESPIETLPRIGYRFRGPVQIVAAASAEVDADGAEPAAPQVEAPLSRAAAPASYARWSVVVGLSVAIGVAGAFAVSARLHHRVLAENAKAHRRVAVLTFQNLAQTPETGWLRAAFQETVSTDLAENSDLEIISNDDVDRAEKELGIADKASLDADTLRRLCDDLECDDVVTGSYLATGDSIRLNTHLLDARDGRSLGNDTQTQTPGRLVGLIAANTRAIRQEFGLPVDPSGEAVAGVSADPEAFALYSKGVEQMHLYDGPAAAKLFEASIAIDPRFPLAHLAYSSALTIEGDVQHAAEQARIAQSLSGTLSRRMQLAIQARRQQTEGRFDEAAATFQTLASFYPDDMEYLWMRAAMLQDGGHPDQAIALLLPVVNDKAGTGRDLAPAARRDPRLYSQLSDAYGLAGNWPASLEWARHGEEEARRRGATVLYERLLTSESQAELYMNQLPQAEASTREALRLAPQFTDRSGQLRALNRMGQVKTAQGKLSEANDVLKEALALEEAGGETQREIHTLSALGQNLSRSNDHSGATAVFARELKLAQTLGQPDTTLGAKLDVAREETVSGRRKIGLEHLAAVLQGSLLIGDKQIQTEASAAIHNVSS